MSVAVLLVSAVLTAGADQLAKSLAMRRLPRRRRGTGRLWGLRRATNLQGAVVPAARWAALAAWVVLAGFVAVVVVRGVRFPVPAAVGLGLVLGGAASNLADRFLRAGVLDYISIGRWPVFNLADAAMVAGSILSAWSLLS